MASFQKFNGTGLAAFTGKLNLSTDTLKVALVASANTPVATNTKLADLTEITYTNISARTVTVSSITQTSGVMKLVCADLTLTVSGGDANPFRYVVLYDDTATNKDLLGFWDYSRDLTLLNGETFLIDFDGVNGVFQES